MVDEHKPCPDGCPEAETARTAPKASAVRAATTAAEASAGISDREALTLPVSASQLRGISETLRELGVAPARVAVEGVAVAEPAELRAAAEMPRVETVPPPMALPFAFPAETIPERRAPEVPGMFTLGEATVDVRGAPHLSVYARHELSVAIAAFGVTLPGRFQSRGQEKVEGRDYNVKEVTVEAGDTLSELLQKVCGKVPSDALVKLNGKQNGIDPDKIRTGQKLKLYCPKEEGPPEPPKEPEKPVPSGRTPQEEKNIEDKRQMIKNLTVLQEGYQKQFDAEKNVDKQNEIQRKLEDVKNRLIYWRELLDAELLGRPFPKQPAPPEVPVGVGQDYSVCCDGKSRKASVVCGDDMAPLINKWVNDAINNRTGVMSDVLAKLGDPDDPDLGLFAFLRKNGVFERKIFAGYERADLATGFINLCGHCVSYDKLAHFLASGDAAWRHGPVKARLMGNLKEFFDKLRGGGFTDSAEDQAANAAGRSWENDMRLQSLSLDICKYVTDDWAHAIRNVKVCNH